jgi:hypothetical protein
VLEKPNREEFLTTLKLCAISGFRREVAEKCAFLGYYYAASSGNCLALRHNPKQRSSDAEIANIKWCQRLIN